MKYKSAVAAALLALAGTTASAGILGDVVRIEFQYPTAGMAYDPETTLTGAVGASGLTLNLFDNQSITVFDSYVQLKGMRDPTSSFGSAAFAGFQIIDVTHPGAFSGYSIDVGATTVPGFDKSRVSISDGALFLNFHDLVTPYGSVAKVNFSTAPVPEPETYGMLMAGLGVLGAMSRRRRSKVASA